MVGCGRQGLGMSLELPGVCLPHPAAPDQEWCPRFSTPASTCGKEVGFNTGARRNILCAAAHVPWYSTLAQGEAVLEACHGTVSMASRPLDTDCIQGANEPQVGQPTTLLPFGLWSASDVRVSRPEVRGTITEDDARDE